jgi:hypothetical protein
VTTLLRCAVAAVLLAVGAATALAAVAVHELWWGLPLTAAAVVAGLLAVGRGWSTRLPVSLGFVGGVAWFVRERPEGDYAIASSVRGYLLLLLACLVLALAVATLPRPRRGTVPESTGPPA